MGTPSFRSSAGQRPGEGAPVRGPFGGPRPTRPSGLRADTLPTLCGGGAAARPVTALQAVPGNVAAKAAPTARPGQVGRQPLLGGTLPQSKAKPLRGRFQRALLCSPPSPVAA